MTRISGKVLHISTDYRGSGILLRYRDYEEAMEFWSPVPLNHVHTGDSVRLHILDRIIDSVEII